VTPRAPPPSRCQPAELAAPQQHLDDVYAVARAAISALHSPVPPPAIVHAVLSEIGEQPSAPGSSGNVAGTGVFSVPAHGQRRQLAPVTGFGATIADIMLHNRRDDPDPVIATWIAEAGTSHGPKAGPANMLAHWSSTSPALQAALVWPIARQLDTFYQLRYRALAGPARVPDPARASERAAALPALLWPGWALRLMPPEGFDLLRYRFALIIMLAVAATGADSYYAAQELLGMHPVHASRFPAFIARLRQHEAFEPVTAAICQLVRKPDEHGTPIDYARRRRLRRLSEARLDVTSWRRQRYFLTHPDTSAHRCHIDHADLPAATFQERLARLPPVAARAVRLTAAQPQGHRRRDRYPRQQPRCGSPQRGHPRPPGHQRPRPPPGKPRRTRRVPASGLGRLHPAARRAADPPDPRAPRAAGHGGTRQHTQHGGGRRQRTGSGKFLSPARRDGPERTAW
jgi:hypothetical protein